MAIQLPNGVEVGVFGKCYARLIVMYFLSACRRSPTLESVALTRETIRGQICRCVIVNGLRGGCIRTIVLVEGNGYLGW